MSPDHEERLARELAGLVRGPDGEGPAGRPPAQAARSFAALEAKRTRARGVARTRGLAFALAGCALVAGAGGFWARSRLGDGRRASLTYALDGVPAQGVGSDIRAAAAGSSTQPSVLAFSDGTRIQMAAEARGRVVALDRNGGRIALEDGRAHVQVVHRPEARWVFEAGPFTIHVHGTEFSFGWNARASHFDLKMDSGVVSVTGPVSGGEIYLRAGETLSIGLAERTAAAAPVSVPHTADVAARPPADRPPAVAEAPRAVRPRASASWVGLLADGEAAAIVADAERRGVDRALADCTSEELGALADAARFQRNDGLARKALLAQRRRFPTSVRAAEASFLLGRLDDESGRGGQDGPQRALAWYDRYLAEARGGAYVSEALGRKMMVLERSGRRTDAATIAADYLRRFPKGTYAHAAEALVDAR
jgi:hypothetical protein